VDPGSEGEVFVVLAVEGHAVEHDVGFAHDDLEVVDDDGEGAGADQTGPHEHGGVEGCDARLGCIGLEPEAKGFERGFREVGDVSQGVIGAAQIVHDLVGEFGAGLEDGGGYWGGGSHWCWPVWAGEAAGRTNKGLCRWGCSARW